MKKRTIVTIAFAALLAFSPEVLARGGQQGGGSGGGQGQGQGTQARQTQRTQARVHATSAQRGQFQAACANGTQARQQVHSIARSQKKSGADTGQARAQRGSLRENVRTIDQEHRRLVEGLDAEQQYALQDRVRETNRLVKEVDERHRSLDRALADPSTDSREISERAKELDRAMKEWQKEYRKLGSEMGVEAG